MYYMMIADPEGNYSNESGGRFSISVVRRIRNNHGINEGYKEFPSLGAALEYWGLVRL